MTSPSCGRPISPDERRLVEWLLDRTPVDGRPPRTSLDGARVVPGCTCGCPSFAIEGAADEPIAGGPIVQAYADLADGHGLFVLLWADRDGVRSVEVATTRDRSDVPLPRPEDLTIHAAR